MKQGFVECPGPPLPALRVIEAWEWLEFTCYQNFRIESRGHVTKQDSGWEGVGIQRCNFRHSELQFGPPSTLHCCHVCVCVCHDDSRVTVSVQKLWRNSYSRGLHIHICMHRETHTPMYYKITEGQGCFPEGSDSINEDAKRFNKWRCHNMP